MKRGKILTILFITIFLSVVLAFAELPSLSHNKKISEKGVTFDGKQVMGNKLLEKYKPLEIRDNFGNGNILLETYLSEHDFTCREDCNSTIMMKMHKDGILIEDAYHIKINKFGLESKINVNGGFYIKIGEIQVEVDDYIIKCAKWCERIKIGSHFETRNLYEEYHLGDTVNAGIYEVQHRGKKRYYESKDWVIKSQGVYLTSMADWGEENEVIYDEFNDPVINNALWTNETLVNEGLNAIAEQTLNGYHYRYMNDDSATGKGIKEVISNNFLNLTEMKNIKNLTIGYALTHTGGGQGVTTHGIIDIFGEQILNEGGTTGWKNITFDLIKDDSQFDVYYDTVFQETFTPTDDIINFTLTFISPTTGQTGEDRIYYVRYWLYDATIILNSPTNNYTSSTNLVEFNATGIVTTGESLVNRTIIVYNLDGSINKTNVTSGLVSTEYTNISTIDLAEGIYNWTAKYCDSVHDCGYGENWTININTNPNINITYPLNDSSYENNTIEIIYEVSDLNLDSCWWSNDSGIINNSITCGTNLTFNATQGLNTFTIWANDSTNNLNSSSITFTIDGFIKTEGSWIFLNPQLNKQTSWVNSLTVSSSLNYDYNETLNISTDVLAIPSSIKVLDSSSNLVTHYFNQTTGIINWTGHIPKEDTTFFSISYNTTEILLNSTPWNRTLGGVNYEYYNLTIDSNSTRTVTNVYSFFNFSDTGIIQNTFYKCSNGTLNCTEDISNRADVVFSDNNDVTGFDKIEWFISTLSNSSYFLENKAGFPISVTQNIQILNPPIRPFDNVEWRNTITLYNPNSFQSEKILKVELPLGSREITLDSISKTLVYDTAGTLNPFIQIIDKNDPTHPSSVFCIR